MDLRVDGKPVFAAGGGHAFKPEQPTVVFLHGAGCDHTVWTLQTRYFAHHGRNVVAVDLPGHGRSPGPALAGVRELADWTIRAVDALGAERVALIGHSMGALVALDAAARHPDRLWALALLGAAETMRVHPDLLAFARAHDLRAAELVVDWGYSRRAHLGGYRAPGVWMMGAGQRLVERNLAVLGTDLAACDAYSGAAAAAGQVQCPTLILAGAADRMTPPAGAESLASRIAGARLVVLPEAGHMMMIEQPDATLDALREVV